MTNENTPLSTPAAAVALSPAGDDLYRVKLSGRHIGSVRNTYRGWTPLGAFLLTPDWDAFYYRTKEAAAQALILAYQRRAKLKAERRAAVERRLEGR